MAKIRALGTTISFNAKTIGKLTSIGEITPDSEELDSTTLDSSGGYREFIQGFKDAGELSLSGYYDKNDTGQAELISAYNGANSEKAVVITFPSSGGGATFNAWVKGFTLGAAEVDGIVGFGATLRITGAVTVTV